ncbi:hypothetical protein [Rhodoferax sp.]|uniref:hypothetical protein n=1 Tax=Rhodoferax sp. TaxID=50421 RepID=UPI0025D2FBD0|nr:hypothetical protein [Rhodoferax sp.]MCM2340459.1 hypothetical protein [Rhodoferax sp.]
MNAFLPPWLIAAALAGALSFYGGFQYSDNAWQARQAKQVQAQAQALQAEVQRSHEAATKSIQEQLALQKSYTVLKEKFDVFSNRGPLVVLRNSAGAVCPAGVLPGGAVADEHPGDSQGSGPAGGGDSAGAAVSLTAGAVWMWNSALAGTDAPAGACGAADPTSPACAVDAGVSIAAAWANHTANAQACAADRLRHQRLIDYVTAAQGTP